MENWEIFETADGSPTLIWPTQNSTEAMHSRQGALSETIYIYYEAIKFVTRSDWPATFSSVGLGLGYNELIIAAHFIKEKYSKPTYLESFESDPALRDGFVDWIAGHSQSSTITRARNQILDMVAKHFDVPPNFILSVLQEWQDRGKWKISDALTPQTRFAQKFSCILYDAFSSRATPELWEEQELINYLSKMAAHKCVFATYAATGRLNRALRQQGFLLEDRKGFAHKRESTFAVRCIAK